MQIEALLPSPIQKVEIPFITDRGIQLYIKRDDLIHPKVSGNKYRKLKYNILKIRAEGKYQIITFGGAFSNHIHAFAAACYYEGLKAIGIIRGEIDEQNPTLRYCKNIGMELISVSRSAYRDKENSPEIQQILARYPNAIVIPEGGTNDLALNGVAGIIDEIRSQDFPNPDYIVLASGTGGTTAGLLSSDSLHSKVLSFSTLNSKHLKSEILQLVKEKNADKLEVNTDYHFGGYAKWTEGLLRFIDDFERETLVPLDHVYNGKAMYGLMDLIQKDYFPSGSTILYLHTGGLQGKDGLAYMMAKNRISVGSGLMTDNLK
jgi:1-aminocyclopropane-1-carboxylate deaminase